MGTAVGYLYLKALVAAVDRYNADTVVPLDLAREYQGPFKAVVLGFAAYRYHFNSGTAKANFPPARRASNWRNQQPRMLSFAGRH